MTIDYLLNAFITLFVTVDPPGLAPLFIALTAKLSASQRTSIALRATLIAGLVLIAFALFGEKLLGALGITVAAFRIAGGLLLFWIAFEMVFDRRTPRKSEDAERALTRDEVRNIAVFPMAIPLISGPGAISATILAASHAPGPLALAAFILVIAVVVGSCLAVFMMASRVNHLLGETGRIVIERLLGLILAALAVQFVADGIKAIAL